MFPNEGIRGGLLSARPASNAYCLTPNASCRVQPSAVLTMVLLFIPRSLPGMTSNLPMMTSSLPRMTSICPK
ncbi:hypothetical protein ACOMHN_013512 [Nucella lapillus]